MTLTKNDILFLQSLQRASNAKKEGFNKTIVTSKDLISKELLDIFEVKPESQGGWFFNVYVEFEPMFKEQEAKEWQI
jgi:hypothetical protein